MTEAQPRFATPLTEGRRNMVKQADKIAAALGTPLMDWQRDCIALFTELRDNGHWAYSTGTLIVPRQCGKSTLALVLLLLRCLGTPNTKAFFSAQQLKESRQMLLDTWKPALDQSILAGTFTSRLANGSEMLKFQNGSSIELLVSTSKTAIHGRVADVAVLDEAFAYQDSRTENAIIPAQITRANHGGGPQTWIISTAGTPTDSPYLLEKVERGRENVTNNVTEGSCYIEYSADPCDDPMSEDTWAKCNPALGHTIDLASIRSEFATLDRNDFLRSRLCVWTSAMIEPVVSLAVWQDLEEKFSSPGDGGLDLRLRCLAGLRVRLDRCCQSQTRWSSACRAHRQRGWNRMAGRSVEDVLLQVPATVRGG